MFRGYTPQISGVDHVPYSVTKGELRASQFPFIVLTSNGEKDFSAAFKRRCLCLHIDRPDEDELTRILESHLAGCSKLEPVKEMIAEFSKGLQDSTKDYSGDQLLNAVQLLLNADFSQAQREEILRELRQPL